MATKQKTSKKTSPKRRKGDEIQLTKKDEAVLAKVWDKIGKKKNKGK